MRSSCGCSHSRAGPLGRQRVLSGLAKTGMWIARIDAMRSCRAPRTVFCWYWAQPRRRPLPGFTWPSLVLSTRQALEGRTPPPPSPSINGNTHVSVVISLYTMGSNIFTHFGPALVDYFWEKREFLLRGGSKMADSWPVTKAGSALFVLFDRLLIFSQSTRKYF